MQTRTIVGALALIAALLHMSAARAADAEAGGKFFTRTCGPCHATAANAPNRIGPTLFGVVGRRSGSVPGFRYSEANKSANITWTPETLDKYLADPKGLIPGTTMAYAGVKKDEDRADVIAYLQTLK